MAGTNGDQDLTEFHKRQDPFLGENIDHKSLIKSYDEYATQYDGDMIKQAEHKKYVGAEEIAEVVTDKDALILDLGAGTGIVGQYLSDRGYKNVDALEPSEGMVNEARKKNVYKNFIMELFGSGPSSIKDGTYDAIVCVGALVKNHITDEAFPEVLRVTKNGGYVVFLTALGRMEKELEQYEKSMQKLVDEGRWSWVKRREVPDYLKGQLGICFVLKKSQ